MESCYDNTGVILSIRNSCQVKQRAWSRTIVLIVLIANPKPQLYLENLGATEL